MTVAEAAERLEISKEAVRKRISRGSLRADKDADGTVRVYVPVSPTPSGTASWSFDRDELVAELRARIEDLRTDRDAWRDQARRSDYMASTAIDRTRELEGRLREIEAGPEPASASGATEATANPGPTDAPTEATDGPQTDAQRRPWWRRVFGG
jgi:excisionase family DNA binding protein